MSVPTPKTAPAFIVWHRTRPSKRWIRLGGFRNSHDAQEALEAFLAERRNLGQRSVDVYVQESADPNEVISHEGGTF
jgi:hypothetical protein